MTSRYRLDARPGLSAAVRRTALECLEEAQRRLDERDAESVHDARKRLKELRALWALSRGALDPLTRQREANAFRAIARLLSEAREAEARVLCFDALLAHFADLVPADAFAGIRQTLVLERDRLVQCSTREDVRNAVVRELVRTRDRLSQAPIHADAWADLEPGFRRMYGRARRAMRQAYAEPSPECFHEWRKRAKGHYYHVELLALTRASGVSSRRKPLKALSDLLGDDHDLADFTAYLTTHQTELGPVAVGVLSKLSERRSEEIRAEARKLGRRLFRDRPRRFVSKARKKLAPWFAEGARREGPGLRKAQSPGAMAHGADSVASSLNVAAGIKTP